MTEAVQQRDEEIHRLETHLIGAMRIAGLLPMGPLTDVERARVHKTVQYLHLAGVRHT